MYKNDTIISPAYSIKDALKQMDKVTCKTLFIERENKLYAALSDGDLRRAILNEVSLSEPVDTISNKSPKFVLENYTEEEVKNLFLELKIEAIPVLDNNHRIINILYWDNVFGGKKGKKKEKLDVPVIIMAGGQGTRLLPFTQILPKPLIPIGDRTMLEVIIDEYRKYEIDRFFISVNHKSAIIKAYFEDLKPDYTISFIEEEKPLGTAGALSLLPALPDKPIFISNCDIIIQHDYAEILNFHNNNDCSITLVASMQHYKIPYGVCELDKSGMLKGITEKPEYDFLVNTGMYILNPEVLTCIPGNTFFHITDLIEKIRKNGQKIGVFPVSEKSWVDVGQWNEYKKSLDDLTIEKI